MKTYAIVLAAGKGTRMKSDLPKVMHTISGVPMIEHVVRSVETLQVDEIYVITGHGASEVEGLFTDNRVTFVRQEEQLGTGHAVMQVAPYLQGKEGKTLILTGDTPLIESSTLKELVDLSVSKNATGVVLSTTQPDPTGYGRILHHPNEESVAYIVEEKDASEEQKRVKEVNTGIFCFDNSLLFDLLPQVTNNNQQQEYYLTDLVHIFNINGQKVYSLQKEDPSEFLGVNDRYQLAVSETIHQQRVKKRHMLSGVRLLLPDTSYIEEDVVIGENTIIEGNVTLKGNTVIEGNVTITAGSRIANSTISSYTLVQQSVITDSVIGQHVTIGPFAHIRPNTTLEEGVRIGNFVETKNAHFAKSAKASHLSYIGDAEIGERVNLGCGSITVNYDGKNKHKTIIKNGAFIGCNVNLVAPVTVEEDSIVAAGSTITKNVPKQALAIARNRQENKENYVKKENE